VYKVIIYKELIVSGNKSLLDEFRKHISEFSTPDWTYVARDGELEDYVCFDYCGAVFPEAELSFYCGSDAYDEGSFQVGNIVPLKKNQLDIKEYNSLLDSFYDEVLAPFHRKFSCLAITGPTNDKFDPLSVISEEALRKLKKFCNAANKTTGSSHPCDEERWFDFICQTVVDNKIFDYDTLYRFLKDEDYWGEKDPKLLGPIGHFAWDDEHASELAQEYENYVNILQYYRKWSNS
jgi:hypothetical protein